MRCRPRSAPRGSKRLTAEPAKCCRNRSRGYIYTTLKCNSTPTITNAETRETEKDISDSENELRLPDMEMRRGASIKHIGGATMPEIARPIESMEGKRVPEMSKVAKAYGGPVERAPHISQRGSRQNSHWPD